MGVVRRTAMVMTAALLSKRIFSMSLSRTTDENQIAKMQKVAKTFCCKRLAF